MPETSRLDGLGDLRQAFAQARAATRMARLVVAAGRRVLREEARAKAAAHGLRRTGALINNIVIKRERNAPEGVAQYHLGVRHGQSMTKGQKAAGKRLKINGRGRVVTEYTNDPWYWRFAEFGTKRQQATSFLASALDAKAPQALSAMTLACRRAIARQDRS